MESRSQPIRLTSIANLPSRLHRVGMEINVGFGGDLADLFDRLQHAGLIVRHHDGDELGVRTQGAANIVGIDQPAAVHRHIRDFAARFFQMLAGFSTA